MNQEPDFEVPNQEEDDLQFQESINLSLLDLDSFKNNNQNRHPCTTSACNATTSNPLKRSSPEQIWKPKSKKPSLHNHPYSLSGFSKLPLPKLHWTTALLLTLVPLQKANLSENAKALEIECYQVAKT